ncbi:TIGR03086 family metal-binding protein [Nocardioides sp. KR10-350]|uniref:TIGR03086 family metal-binding protein n=1 Tax=Nocardioides cheoyonin TaxID=3156615 RepID=UPI0032B3FD33
MVSPDSLRILSHALDQAGDVLDHVHAGVLDHPTPCSRWDVAALADHLINDPRQFLAAMKGEDVDWGAPPPHVTEGWGPTFRVAADDLIHFWHEHAGDDVQTPPEMQIAELAVHTWDLATALGRPPTSSLDPEVAETGLGFLRAMLKPEMRGDAFAPEQTVPDGAGVYERIAAFAGRTPLPV